VKLTLQTQLLPDKEQSRQLRETLERFNAAANWLAKKAFAEQSANKVELQRAYYRELRARFGLSAQMAVRCIAQTCEAYKRDKSVQPEFRKHAAMPYDQRLMGFKGLDRVSLLTLEGRIIVPLLMGKYQRERFTAAKGQSDLVLRKDGKWFLLVTVDLPDKTPIPSTDFLGVDLGVVNLAVDSDGDTGSPLGTGENVEAVRVRMASLRHELQRKASAQKKTGKRPKNIRRKLRKVGKKEAIRRDVNHRISKKIVEKAKDTKRGIALEDLTGIRGRTRFRKQQRSRMGGWAFLQMRQFLSYKAQRQGVPVLLVDSRNTSRECSVCGHTEKGNRPTQSKFRCRQCGFEENADRNAARNIRARALVMLPTVAEASDAA
jgi:putative transposase